MKKDIDDIETKIYDLPFKVPLYYEDFITRDIFSAILADRKQILELLKDEA